MTRFVLDASVALGWLIDSPIPAYAVKIQKALLAGARAAVPSLWHLEVANGLLVAERRGFLAGPQVDRAVAALESLVQQAIETRSDLFFIRAAVADGRSFQLSSYDAHYLDLARSESLPLATLDRALRSACEKAGVPVVA